MIELTPHPVDARRVVVRMKDGAEHMCINIRVPDAYKLAQAILAADLWFEQPAPAAA